MTAAFLQTDLSSLIQDSRRKHNDVRTATEKSLADLKSISVTSEAQLAADLIRKPLFIDPFILACKSNNVKLATTGTVCLQRLTASKALAPQRLQDVLDALQACVGYSLDIQLKILQTLPSLLSLYGSDLHGALLARVLEICGTLQSSKNATAVISSTAAATFQQLLTTVFERDQTHGASNSRGRPRTDERSYRSASDDATALFADCCAYIAQTETTFVDFTGLSIDFMLEAVHAILVNYGSVLEGASERREACQQHLLPGLQKLLTSKAGFSTCVRVLRLVYVQTKNYLHTIRDSLYQTLLAIVGFVDRDAGPTWKRVLCMEFLRAIVSDFQLLRRTYELFDGHDRNDGFITKLMAAVVRLSSEDPSLIGLGRQSTIPSQRNAGEMTSVDDQGAGVGSVMSAEASVTGISSDWSTMTTSCLDQLDKTTAPDIPTTYIYTLALSCIAAFSDGLSKFVMPISVPARITVSAINDDDDETESTDRPENASTRRQAQADKYQRLVNPLTSGTLPQQASVQVCASMIESCWPAILATCSTFLNAALDSHFYHILIRSVQKLAQVSGVLQLHTPRDALLTSLAKASVPSNVTAIISSLYGGRLAKNHAASEAPDMEDAIESPRSSSHSVDTNQHLLNVRHLLCLRALLNLGIALGPTLTLDSWLILFETMQQVEGLTSIPALSRTSTGVKSAVNSEEVGNLGSEITAVKTASKRLIESTRGYNEEAFVVVLSALFRLIGQDTATPTDQSKDVISPSPTTSSPTSTKRPGGRMHQHSRSVSAVWNQTPTLELEVEFVLGKVNDLARVNLYRFASNPARPISWSLIIDTLLNMARSAENNDNLRLQAATIVDHICMETAKLLDREKQSLEEVDTILSDCLRSLREQVGIAYHHVGQTTPTQLEEDIMRRVLQSVETIVAHSGDSISQGWNLVFSIIKAIFHEPGLRRGVESGDEEDAMLGEIIPVAFRSIQLVVEDFIGVLAPTDVATLLLVLRYFGTQKQDFNIALTTTRLFWDVTSNLLHRTPIIDADQLSFEPDQHFDQLRKAADTQSKVSFLWGVAVCQLGIICKDQEAEVQKASVSVLLKIFEASSPVLTPRTWNLSLNVILMQVLQAYINAPLSEHQIPEEVSTQLLAGLVALVSDQFDVIAEGLGFQQTWKALFDLLDKMLESGMIIDVIYSSMIKLLEALQQSGQAKADLARPAVAIWLRRHPYVKDVAPLKSNQKACAAYAGVLPAAYQCCREAVFDYEDGGRDSLCTLIQEAVRRIVFGTRHLRYSNDIKQLASEQTHVLAILSILEDLMSESTREYTLFVLDLVKQALESTPKDDFTLPTKQSKSASYQAPSFIAFISSCVDRLRGLVELHGQDNKSMSKIAGPETLTLLSSLIGTKYAKIGTNQDSPLWRNATLTAVLLAESMQTWATRSTNHGSHLDPSAEAIVLTAASILRPGVLDEVVMKPSAELLTADETFDIAHFRRLHKAGVPLLAASSQAMGKRYVITLLRASLAAKPWYRDFPAEQNLLNKPLDNFMKVRMGTVVDPKYPFRTRICYTALDALFELVEKAASDLSSPETTLAGTAAPYVMFRIAHSLKVFLADQHLRGLSPLPKPLQTELSTLLTKCLDLRSDDAAFAKLANPGVNLGNDGKGHLRLLTPLVLQVRQLWHRLPKLGGPGTWQEEGPGAEIEKCLMFDWDRVLAREWELA